MTIDDELRNLTIDLPTQPESLAELSVLLAQSDANLHAVARLIESDMALAAAVLKAVNSSIYGLKGRVQSVQQAITYLGMREVAAVTFEMGLRAVCPDATELQPVWERASVRGVLMGRLARELGLDSWAAHSAGLFEECGKAVLFRHAPARYRPLLAAKTDDTALAAAELAAFGISHDSLGAALCETWGLAAPAAASVRHHITVQSTGRIPMQLPRRGLCVLSAVAHTMMTGPDALDEVAATLAPQADLDAALVARGARRVMQQIEDALAA
jgi:HD-like signal output (HDOD) protein